MYDWYHLMNQHGTCPVCRRTLDEATEHVNDEPSSNEASGGGSFRRAGATERRRGGGRSSWEHRASFFDSDVPRHARRGHQPPECSNAAISGSNAARTFSNSNSNWREPNPHREFQRGLIDYFTNRNSGASNSHRQHHEPPRTTRFTTSAHSSAAGIIRSSRPEFPSVRVAGDSYPFRHSLTSPPLPQLRPPCESAAAAAAASSSASSGRSNKFQFNPNAPEFVPRAPFEPTATVFTDEMLSASQVRPVNAPSIQAPWQRPPYQPTPLEQRQHFQNQSRSPPQTTVIRSGVVPTDIVLPRHPPMQSLLSPDAEASNPVLSNILNALHLSVGALSYSTRVHVASGHMAAV